ncbi:MAG: toll/interleukin-1 receptor domain-containing protein, partial [Anaerolineae bacterium]|nr:toll/interleukin-1 receptor domain-containing protein [Anaerolineae bacterium]
MTVVTKIFISHRNSQNSNKAARKIEAALLAKEYEVFFDENSIKPGMLWDDAIINGLRTAEALVLVIDDTTVESDWVQREVDIARALRVSVLPVMIDLGDKTKQEEAYKRLHLGTLQYMLFDAFEADASAEKVAEAVVPLIEATLENQTDSWNNWYTRREERRVFETTPQVEENSWLYRLTHPEIPGVTFQIATG